MAGKTLKTFISIGWMVACLFIPVVILLLLSEPTKLQMMILRLVSAVLVSSVAAHAVQRFFRSKVTTRMHLVIRVLLFVVGFASLDLWVVPALQWTARGGQQPKLSYEQVWAVGAELMGKGEYTQAQAHYTERCPEIRNIGDAHVYTLCLLQLSEAALRGAQLDQARGALGRALEWLPDDPGLVGNVQEMLARVEMTATRATHGIGKPVQAPDSVVSALDRALAAYVEAEDPVGQANVWLRRADLSLMSGDYAAGDHALSQAADLYRQHQAEAGLAATEHLHGDLARKQGKLEHANTHYQEALKLYRKLGDSTGEASVTTSLGGLLLAQGEKKAAGESFEQASRIFADNGNAELEQKLQQQKASLAELTPETPVVPLTAEELVVQARAAASNKQRSKAEKLLRQATDLKPDDANALSLLARVLMEQSKWAESEAVLIRVLTIEPDMLAANNNLGLCEMQQGNYKAAKTRFEKVLSFDDDFAPALYNLALVNQKLGRKRTAKKQAKRFSGIRPTSIQTKKLQRELL